VEPPDIAGLEGAGLMIKASLTQQRQHVLRRLVGLSDHRGGCLAEDLGLGHGGGFGRIVGILDAAAGIRQVGDVVGQVVDRRFEPVLACAQRGARGVDFQEIARAMS